MTMMCDFYFENEIMNKTSTTTSSAVSGSLILDEMLIPFNQQAAFID